MLTLTLEDYHEYDDDASTDIEISDEIDEHGGDFTAIYEEGEHLISVITALEKINSNIQKFGVTDELVHLVTNMVDVSSFSSDVKMSLEMDIYAQMQNIKKILKDYFNKVLAAITKFFNRYFTSLGWLQAKVKKIEKDAFGSNGRFIDEDDFLNKSAGAAPRHDWILLMHGLIEATKEISKIKFNSDDGFDFSNCSKLEQALTSLGYSLKFNSNSGLYTLTAGKAPTYPSRKIGELDWTIDFVDSKLQMVPSYCRRIEAIKFLKTNLETYKKTATDPNDKYFRVPKSIVINQVSIATRCANIILKAFLKYMWQLANVAGKAKLKLK